MSVARCKRGTRVVVKKTSGILARAHVQMTAIYVQLQDRHRATLGESKAVRFKESSAFEWHKRICRMQAFSAVASLLHAAGPGGNENGTSDDLRIIGKRQHTRRNPYVPRTGKGNTLSRNEAEGDADHAASSSDMRLKWWLVTTNFQYERGEEENHIFHVKNRWTQQKLQDWLVPKIGGKWKSRPNRERG